MPSPIVLLPNEGEAFAAGPLRIVSRVQGNQSSEAFELYELTLGPSTVDYHVHKTMDETLCVVEGQIEFNVAGTKFLRPAGSVAFIPRGVHHGFTNLGPARARVLVSFTPSRSQHEYFRELQKLFAVTPLNTAALQDLQRRYDQELVPEEFAESDEVNAPAISGLVASRIPDGTVPVHAGYSR